MQWKLIWSVIVFAIIEVNCQEGSDLTAEQQQYQQQQYQEQQYQQQQYQQQQQQYQQQQQQQQQGQQQPTEVQQTNQGDVAQVSNTAAAPANQTINGKAPKVKGGNRNGTKTGKGKKGGKGRKRRRGGKRKQRTTTTATPVNRPPADMSNMQGKNATAGLSMIETSGGIVRRKKGKGKGGKRPQAPRPPGA